MAPVVSVIYSDREGGARCGECGVNGVCERGECACRGGYTGPACKSPPGFNDKNLDPDSDQDILPSAPASPLLPVSLRVAIAVGAVMAIVVVAFRLTHDRRKRSVGWVRIGDGIEDDSTFL